MLIFLRRERGFGGCFSRFRLGVVDEPLEPFFLKFFNDVEDPLRVIRPLEPPFFLKLLNDVEDPLRVIRLGLGVNDDPLLSLHCFLAALRFFLSSSTGGLGLAAISNAWSKGLSTDLLLFPFAGVE